MKSSSFFVPVLEDTQMYDNKKLSSLSSCFFVPMLEVIQVHDDEEFGSSLSCFLFVPMLQVLKT
jgi:hypothetical protein